MKILQVNNYGFIRGGSERCFLDISDLLIQKGHHVSYLVSENEKNTVNSSYAVRGFSVDAPSLTSLGSFFYSRQARSQLQRLIEDQRPDIAHLHIYYGQITPSILSVFQSYHIPVVQTLHEYKLLCPVSSMLRDNQSCDLCAKGAVLPAIRHRCNRGSFSRSVVTAAESWSSKFLGVESKIDHFIAVSEFLRNKMIEYGVASSKITTVPNFIQSDKFKKNKRLGDYFLYIGRIEKVKGLVTLIEAMATIHSVPIYIVGDGEAKKELQEQTQQLHLDNIHFVGFQSGQALLDLIAGAICVVNPSECFETFGLVLLESFAQGKPVIASRKGAMTEVVDDMNDGILFEAGNVNELGVALNWMLNHREEAIEMGNKGHEKAMRMYSSEKHYQQMMNVYQQVIQGYNK